MINKFALYGMFVLFFGIVAGCDNTVDVNAPYEEITIVYGLLDAGDTLHQIKVNKAYLNKNKSARSIARNEADSIYHNKPIRVRLQEMNNGNVNKEVRLKKTTLQTKEKGLFPNPETIIYQGQMDLNTSYNYRVIIDKLESGKTISATTSLVSDINLNNPIRGLSKVLSFKEQVSDEIIFDGSTGKNAYFYKYKLVFYVKEVDQNGNSTIDTVRWPFFPKKNTEGESKENFDYELEAKRFFDFMIGEFSTGKAIRRPISEMETKLVITGGGEDLFNYIEVNEPSISIVQKKPEYSNVKNGRGLFSTRRREVYNIQLSSPTKDSLTSIDNLRFTF